MNLKNTSKSSNKHNILEISKISKKSKYSMPRSPSRKLKSNSKRNHKHYKSCKFISKIQKFSKILRQRFEEKEDIEFILGDFKDFHKIEELKNFNNMISLTLINESIKDISIIISNIPNPKNIKYLCLNQNEISEINDIDRLENLEEFQINFNYIDKIPMGINNLKKLKKFWACENNISIIENIPINIENLWLANNYIENIPKNFDKLINLKNLNLSGNLITEISDLYIISNIKNIKQLYLRDINFGENPICFYKNFRKLMVKIFYFVEIIDQIKLNFDEKYETNRCFDININNMIEKIKNNFRITHMIFKLIKAYKLFFLCYQYYNIYISSLKIKFLECKLCIDNNDINSGNIINDINNEIENIKIIIDKKNKYIKNWKNYYYKLKKIIKELNDEFILFNIIKLESYSNIEIKPLSPNTKSALFCVNLIRSQLNQEFLKNNYYNDISINYIYKIKNQKDKYIFNSLYDELIDENNLFGAEKNFYKFLYIILPYDLINNKKKLLEFFLDKEKSENNFFFCDNFSYIDEFEIKLNRKKSYNIGEKLIIIYKCSFFESSVDVVDARFNYFSSIDEIKDYLINLKNNSKKDIVCLKIKSNVNFYIYNNKGLILPKFIIKYNYISTINLNQQFSDFISIYDESNSEVDNLNFDINDENLFNICSKHFFDKHKNILNKYINNEKKFLMHNLTKFYEYNELNNNYFFIIKLTLINFLKKSFKFKDKEEYFNEIKILKHNIEEINDYKIEKNFLNIFNEYIRNKDTKNDINFKKIKKINLFNQKITDDIFNNLLNNISNNLPRFKEISILSITCIELYLSNNKMTIINISKIFNIFPNLQKMDFSHNNISLISFSENEKNKIINKYSTLKYLDLSYNNISDYNIILLLKAFLDNSTEIKTYYNPYEYIINKFKYNNNKNDIFNNNISLLSDNNIFKEIKIFDYICNFYSLTEELNEFKNNEYFNIKKKNIIKNSKDLYIFLNNKNLEEIPDILNNINNYEIDENFNDSNLIIYLNSNKISKIKYFINLFNITELYLQNNKIIVLENLPITLIKLDISNNYISNIDEIVKSINLERINLENNNIINISPIKTLYRLKEINCSNNFIENFEIFGELKNLEIIDLCGNWGDDGAEGMGEGTSKNFRFYMIYNCSSLKKLNKKIITDKERKDANEYFNGKITIEILNERTRNTINIYEENKNLNISNNNNLNIIELDLSNLKLKDGLNLFNKDKYPNLKKLNLSKNFFTSFEIFGILPELVELNLSGNTLSEIIPKKYKNTNINNRFNFTNLKILDISNNQLNNIYGIQYFYKLRKIILKDNSLSKIDCLDRLNDLNYINLSNNKLKFLDKASLGLLPSLKTFFGDNNFLKNINSFEKYKSLELLSFNNNKIADISCLDNLNTLKNLTNLSIINNPINKIENYRKIIILNLPNLKILDNKEIQNNEKSVYNNFKLKSHQSQYLFNKSTKLKLNKCELHYRKNNFLKRMDFSPKLSETRNSNSLLDLNVNILKNKNDKNFNKFLFLSQNNQNQINYDYIPVLKLSNSKNFHNIFLLAKNYQNIKIKNRPFSTKINQAKSFKKNDYYNIVMNSFGNNKYKNSKIFNNINNNLSPLITMKNFNIKKINFS